MPNVKIIDLQHNLLPFEGNTFLTDENGVRIDATTFKSQLKQNKRDIPKKTHEVFGGFI